MVNKIESDLDFAGEYDGLIESAKIFNEYVIHGFDGAIPEREVYALSIQRSVAGTVRVSIKAWTADESGRDVCQIAYSDYESITDALAGIECNLRWGNYHWRADKYGTTRYGTKLNEVNQKRLPKLKKRAD